MNKEAKVFIAIGTNLGDREKNLEKGIEFIRERSLLKNIRRSEIYETEPVGYKDQEWFLNCVISGETDLDARLLLQKLKDGEEELGRTKNLRWREREIDLDIIFYDDLIIDEKDIQIPHPRMHERKFVLNPMIDLYPNWIHPVIKKDMKQLLKLCEDKSEIFTFKPA